MPRRSHQCPMPPVNRQAKAHADSHRCPRPSVKVKRHADPHQCPRPECMLTLAEATWTLAMAHLAATVRHRGSTAPLFPIVADVPLRRAAFKHRTRHPSHWARRAKAPATDWLESGCASQVTFCHYPSAPVPAFGCAVIRPPQTARKPT